MFVQEFSQNYRDWIDSQSRLSKYKGYYGEENTSIWLQTQQYMYFTSLDPCQSVALWPTRQATLEQTPELAMTSLLPTET